MNNNETINSNISPNNNPQPTEPKRFLTMDGNTLMAQEYEPLQYSVEKILPHGLFILAGSGKIGKSWLSLDIGMTVATGGKLWDFPAEQGMALYLALEDTFPRLQERLKIIEADDTDISRLKIATAAFGINSGLFEQINNHMTDFPDTKLIIIDTLERIRDTEYDKSIYSFDYRDMTALREITDAYKLTLLLIHHTRKLNDDDPLNNLSGSMGLVGAVDGVFVLAKETRTGNKAKLTIANRDTPGYCFVLELDPENCKWNFICNEADAEVEADKPTEEKDEWLCMVLDDFIKDVWSGTATELCDTLKSIDENLCVTPLNITKKLKANLTALDEMNIVIDFDQRTSNKRTLVISRRSENLL